MVFHQALFIFVAAAGDAEKSSEAFSNYYTMYRANISSDSKVSNERQSHDSEAIF